MVCYPTYKPAYVLYNVAVKVPAAPPNLHPATNADRPATHDTWPCLITCLLATQANLESHVIAATLRQTYQTTCTTDSIGVALASTTKQMHPTSSQMHTVSSPSITEAVKREG